MLGGHRNFRKFFRPNTERLRSEISKVHSKEDLEAFTRELQKTVTECSNKAYRKKSQKKTKKTSTGGRQTSTHRDTKWLSLSGVLRNKTPRTNN